jgi:Protein of unknown function (DUF3631)
MTDFAAAVAALHHSDDVLQDLEAQEAALLLDEVHAFIGRFVAYPSEHAHVAHTLWITHTHLMGAWESTPRIAFLSPEPGSGKTRALEVSELLVPNAVEAVNVTPAYLFRKVGEGAPTILYDEIDTVFGPKAKDNEEIRGLLNAGHRRGAVAGRCVTRGKIVETEEIPAYCAVALAGLGGLPDTLLSRSIVIRMKRRAPGERVEPYRRRVHEADGAKLRGRLAEWAALHEEDLTAAWPEMPSGIEDRDADLWEPLLAVADAVGGHWPKRARDAAVALVAESKQSTPSLGVRLLVDLHTVFGDLEVMSTKQILRRLCGEEPYGTDDEGRALLLDEAPWAELDKGNPLNPRSLAGYLRQYEVKSKVIRVGETTHRGYAAEDFFDAWSRYLPPPPLEDVTDVTGVTEQDQVTDVTSVTHPRADVPNATACRECGQTLLLVREGRDLCARCEPG